MTDFDLLMLFVIVALVLTFIILRYHQLFLAALDEDLARVSGVRVLALNAAFASLAAGVVAASLQIVGALLIGALMVIPVLAALELRKGFFVTLDILLWMWIAVVGVMGCMLYIYKQRRKC